MDLVTSILTIAAAVLVIFLVIKIISAPIKKIFKFLLNAALGIGILLLVNFVGRYFGIAVDITVLRIIISGIFGLPAVLLIILLSVLGII